jgi:hypothetical protein
MLSSGTLRLVALVRTDASEECSASINRVTRIDELGMLSVMDDCATQPTLKEAHVQLTASVSRHRHRTQGQTSIRLVS